MKITPNIIETIIDNEGFSEKSEFGLLQDNAKELNLHRQTLPVHQLVKQTLSTNEILANYLLGSHQLNKLKRSEPNQKIIDAYDIDWSGYQVNFNGIEYKPKTTFELLDLIFRFLKYLYDLHGDDDVVWNDNGVCRTNNNTLDWFESPVPNKTTGHTEETLIDQYSSKEWH